MTFQKAGGYHWIFFSILWPLQWYTYILQGFLQEALLFCCLALRDKRRRRRRRLKPNKEIDRQKGRAKQFSFIIALAE